MKRLGICAFYDADGVVDEYFIHLVESFANIINKLIIVVNGNMTDVGEEKLLRLGCVVLFRENIGYDAGAIKCGIEYCNNNKVGEMYDEFVIFNDTFFGPFCDWDIVFGDMVMSKCDFWGLSRHKGGCLSDGEMFESHIQTYFMVINKRMFNSPVFINYWNGIQLPIDRLSATMFYELTFTHYFENYGFKSDSWLETKGINFATNINPYSSEIFDELIIKKGFPILKRRAITMERACQIKRIFEYLNKCNKYDIEMIYDNIYRLNKNCSQNLFNLRELDKFYYEHENIYIVGAGKYGQGILKLFLMNQWTFESFVASKEDKNNNIISIDELLSDAL